MNGPVELLIHRLDPDLPMPERELPGDAGFDLYARMDTTLNPGERALIPTGVSIALPDGYVALVHPRSGLAIKHGFTLVNAPGTIDASYRGEISIIGLNAGSDPLTLKRGDRVAQLVLLELPAVTVVEVASLPGSVRNAGGFGSTGGFSSPR